MQSAEYRVQRSRNAGAGKPAFFNLIVWQKAQALAADLTAMVDGLPQKRSANALGNQLLRSGASVAANIAEGYARYSEAAYRSHLSIARGSLFETESWLDLLARFKYVTQATADRSINACEEVARLITSMMKPLKNAKGTAVPEEATEYTTDVD